VKKRISATRLGLALGPLLLAITAGACSSSPTASTSNSGGSSSGAPTLSQIQTQIFDPGCTPCHSDVGRTPSAGMNLKAGSAFANLVNVPSSGLPGAVRVIAGNANGSYIVQKLEGAPGIAGLRMPRNGPPFLTDAQVKMIRDWITAGALNN
jgi:hypothetical protein